MEQSTHFNLNLVTGSDKVNPLTVDRPNYEIIDDQMYKNQTAAISEATELKSSTVHAITCLTEGAVFFRFTATSDFAAGDTFTYNGTPVSAVLPDGTGLPAGAFKVNSTVLCSVVGTLLTVYSYSASGTAADAEKLGGQLPSYYAKATDAIGVYTHSRIGTVNNFVGTGANGKVKFAANIQPGDTVQINGQPVSAYAGATDFVEALANQPLVGKTAYFVFDSTTQTVTFALSRDVQSYTPPAYSTIQTDTGKKWIDGKTVWRKVIPVVLANSTVTKTVELDFTPETVVSLSGFSKTARNGWYQFPGNTDDSPAGSHQNLRINGVNQLVLEHGIDELSGQTCNVVVEYTLP